MNGRQNIVIAGWEGERRKIKERWEEKVSRKRNQEEREKYSVVLVKEDKKTEETGIDKTKQEPSSSALAACGEGRQDGCRGQSTRPNMVIRTELCPTFCDGLNQSLNDAGRTMYGQRAAAPAPVSLMCCAGMSDAGLGPNIQTRPYSAASHTRTYTHTHPSNSLSFIAS